VGGRERGEVLGEGQRAPSHEIGGLGSAVSSPSENFEFGAFWDLKIASKQCNGIKCGNETL